jgi:hypothetical protein
MRLSCVVFSGFAVLVLAAVTRCAELIAAVSVGRGVLPCKSLS